ncbi:Cilia- and flagella-associated protein 74 [Lamellibrachia satsuma]|nr:Cilia- and flagella-associated protein 74 [Lamellibrachia satsuma]
MELEVKSPSIQDDFLEDGEVEEMSFQSNVKDYDEDIDSSSDFDFSDSEIDLEVENTVPDEKISWKDQVRMIHLRRYLDALTKSLDDKNYHLQEARSELQNCRDRLVELKMEADSVQAAIETAINEHNVPSSQRLIAQHERLSKEIHNEKKLESLIKLNVETAEYEVAKAEVEMGKYQLVEEDLWKREEAFQHQQTDIADLRHKREVRYKNLAQKMHKSAELSRLCAVTDRKLREKDMIEKARISHDRTRKFIQGTIDKIRRRVEDEENQEKAFKQKRMDMLIRLKGSITANKENLKAIQARDRALEKKRSQLELKKQQHILDAEGNASEIMMRDNLLKEHAQKTAAFKAADTHRRVEIVERILLEEERMRKRKEVYPFLWPDADNPKCMVVKPRKRKPVKILDEMIAKDEESEKPVELDMSKFEDHSQSDDEDNKFSSFAPTAENTFVPSSDSDEEEGVNLAKPEFEGLWDQHKPYKAPRDGSVNLKPAGGSKMQKDIMQRGLQQQRNGIVIHQVAAGREFKGCPFYSKPDVIHFKV